MADFRTHVTTSTVLGIGYAGAGMLSDVPVDTALVAGGLCGVAGMLPDIDSDSGKPIREVLAFAAAVIPMLFLQRLREMGVSHDAMVFAGGAMYLFIRFGVAALLKRFTVHRGMFHSIPAAIIFAELAFLISGTEDLGLRYYKAAAVFIGVMSHLALDELYSIEWARGRFRKKSSFGTAMKFWGRSMWGNVSTYAKLLVVTALVLGEPMVAERFGPPMHQQIADDMRTQPDGKPAVRETIYDTARRLREQFR